MINCAVQRRMEIIALLFVWYLPTQVGEILQNAVIQHSQVPYTQNY